MDQLDERLLWTYESIPDAIEALLNRTGQALQGSRLPPLYKMAQALSWLREAPRAMGFEGITEEMGLDELDDRILSIETPMFVVIVRGDARSGLCVMPDPHNPSKLLVVGPESKEARFARKRLSKLIRAIGSRESRFAELFHDLPNGKRTYERLVRASPNALAGFGVTTYHLDAAHPLTAQVRHRGGGSILATCLVVSLVQGLVGAGAAWTLGSSALYGHMELGRIVAWAMLAASDAPLVLLLTLMLGRFAVVFGASMKRRLLEGTFLIKESEIRKQGYGALLARMSEAATVERISPREIIGILIPFLQIVIAAWLLVLGVFPVVLLAMLLMFVLGAVVITRLLFKSYSECYGRRLGLTEDLVEKILGHRTRIVQDNVRIQHDAEDAALQDYARSSIQYDRLNALSNILGRLWMIASGITLLVAFVQWAPTSTLFFTAIGIGIANMGIARISSALRLFVAWWVAWEGIKPLVVAGRERDRPSRTGEVVDNEGLATVLSLSALSFSYARGHRTILSDVTLSVSAGEKLLLEGPSGSGKTTLAKLIAGEIRPSSGTSLIHGLDVFALSQSEWRRRVASSPQFHENHVFANSFAFNLEPRSGKGLSRQAVTICEELSLDGLLAKMPQGSLQLLGEVGWQLSHGERSRLFIARSLLQGADIMLFDESFGALDPETLEQTIACVRRHAKTLIVIAHT